MDSGTVACFEAKLIPEHDKHGTSTVIITFRKHTCTYAKTLIIADLEHTYYTLCRKALKVGMPTREAKLSRV